MVLDDWVLLGRLRRAVKKVRFVLNFNIINRWRLASMIGSSSQRRLSFNNRSGLLSFIDDNNNNNTDGADGSNSTRELQRTQSYLSSSDEDIDNRAEMFISNFYRQLQMERQVSLELQYCRGNSLESNRSD
ncbi:Protein of unknown function DUF761 [Macleaya cordata]|uniref:Cotton fiber protein n=1 Tax=Macleaya cordata TaxID=56857 RepID=A0A200QIA4_MACCD|nr:Protein of unknown function DUF761 [Macleaya cordata]